MQLSVSLVENQNVLYMFMIIIIIVLLRFIMTKLWSTVLNIFIILFQGCGKKCSKIFLHVATHFNPC